MLLRSRAMAVLIGRELRSMAPMILSLLGVVLLVVCVTAYRIGVPQALVNTLPTGPTFAFIGIFQFVISQVTKEKAARTFLFLRGLPVSNDEIVTSKIAAILAGASVIFAAPLVALLLIMSHWNVSAPPFAFWMYLWAWIFMLGFGLVSVAAAMQFTQAAALRITGAIALGLFLLGRLAVRSTSITSLFLDSKMFAWGLIPAVAIVVVVWRLVLLRFRRLDFADLVE